jgi:hypothetical protein
MFNTFGVVKEIAFIFYKFPNTQIIVILHY